MSTRKTEKETIQPQEKGLIVTVELGTQLKISNVSIANESIGKENRQQIIIT